MGVVAFVAPLLPGKAEDHRQLCEELVIVGISIGAVVDPAVAGRA